MPFKVKLSWRGRSVSTERPLSAGRRSLFKSCAVAVICMLSVWPLWAQASGPEVGKLAPSLVLNTLDGKTISTDSLRGKVVVIVFWATWCAPCRDELPLLSAYAEKHAEQGLQVLAFSLDDPEKLPEVQRIAANLKFPVGLLDSAWAGGYGRIWKLPASFTINREGILIDNAWNDDNSIWTEQRLQRIVAPLLKQQP